MGARRPRLVASDVRAFVSRDWQAIQSRKDAIWRRRRSGVEATLAMVEGLRRHVAALHPEWPTAADCEADRRAHERLSRLLRRASGGNTD